MRMKKVFHSVLMIMLSIAIMWNFSWLPKPVVKADDDPSDGILMNMTSDVSTVESGKTFTYRITFSFSGLVENSFNFSNMKIVLPLPAGVEYENSVPLSIISGMNQVGNNLEFSLNTGANGPQEGTSYALQVNVHFQSHVTPDGTTATTTAKLVQDDGVSPVVDLDDSDPVTVTATAVADWEIVKTRISPLPIPMVDGEVQYEIFFNNKKSGQDRGVIDIENVKVQDVLPAEAEFVAARPTPTTAPAVGSTGVIEWDLAGAQSEDQRFYVTVKYPAAKVTAGVTTVENSASATFSVPGIAGTTTVSDLDSHGFTDIPDDFGPGGFNKTVETREQEISPGQDVHFYIGGIRNRANVPLSNVVIGDMTPTQDSMGAAVNLDLQEIRTATFTDTSVTYDVYYTTSTAPGPGDWLLWSTVSSTASSNLDVVSLGLGAGQYVMGVEFRFPGDVPVAFSQTSNFEMIYTLRAGSIVPLDGRYIRNTATLDYIFDGAARHGSDPADVYIWGPRPLVRIDKTRDGSGPFVPTTDKADSYVTFKLRVANTNYSSAPFKDPILFDVLPVGFTFDDWSIGDFSGFDPTANNIRIDPAIEPITKDVSGKTLIRWNFPAAGTEMPVDSYFEINVKAKIDKYTPPTTYTNIAGLTSASADYYNDYYFNPFVTDPNDYDGDGNVADSYIGSSATVTVNKVAELGSYKQVRGELDTEWKSGVLPANCDFGDPCDELARTVEGGRVDYKLVVKNNSNFDVDNIVVADVLPRIGDQGALVGARGSTWGTVLTAPLAADPNYTVYYHTGTNHVKISTTTGWSTTPPDDLTTVTALKFVFNPAFILNPGDEVPIVWTMKAPIGTNVDVIAWNSFAHQAKESLGGDALQPAEPPKVGVYIKNADPNKYAIGNYVWVDLDEDGVQDAGEPGVNGVRADLFKHNGTSYVPYQKTFTDGSPAVDVFTLTGPDQAGNPGYYLFPNLDPGLYQVQFTLPGTLPEDYKYNVDTPNEYTNAANPFTSWTGKGLGGNAELDSNVGGAAATVTTDPINLGADDDLSIDAGLIPPLGAIGNYVWQDANGNGIQDEPATSGINGVQVELFKETAANVWTSQGTTTTAALGGDPTKPGYYEFTGLLPGKYKVQFPQEVGTPGNESIVTFPGKGSETLDSNPNALGESDVITLQLGEINHTVDAGYVLPVEIGDKVWKDTDYDGVQDGGEPAVPGITVKLLNTSNQPVKAADGTTDRTATTDGSGLYKFDKLLPGTYRVEFVLPDADHGFTRKKVTSGGGNDTNDSNVNRSDDIATTPQTSGRTDNIAVTTPGASDMTIDAGIVELVSLGDKVWRDNDRDGVQDAGEPGVGGVAVTLYYDDASTTTAYRTATTPADGSYSFTKLYPGKYTVQFERPDGYVYTAKGLGGDAAADSNVNVPALASTVAAKTDQIDLGADDITIDAGLVPLASLGNFVWVDTDADGIQDAGESGLAGVKVELFNHDGTAKITHNAYGTAILDITTDGTGAYLFDKLPAGTYVVKFTLPTGYTFTAPNEGSDDAVDSDAIAVVGAPSNGASAPVELDAGENDLTVDAGALAYASLGDLVWHDNNGNGIQNAGELGVPNVTVTLYEDDGSTPVTHNAYGNLISPATTDANGKYSFTHLPPGQYKVKFNLPAAYTDFTSANASGSTEINDSDVDENGWTDAVALTWNMNNPNVDAGVVGITSLGDLLWYDVNGNGIQDTGELGVPNVKVELYEASDLNTVLKSMQTGNDGKYLFNNLWPGSYIIKFYLPSEYYFFSPRFSGGDSTKDSNANPAAGASFGMTEQVTIASTGSNLTLDAGIVELASIGDTLWNDTIYDGILNGENGYPGVTVHLLNNAGVPILNAGTPVTTTTDANGKYLFEKLVPGDYKVKFDLPTGYIFTKKQAVGSTTSNDSNVNPATGITDTITLLPGTHNMTVDAGIVKLASLGDYVWMDKTPGGTQSAGELGVSGVNVQVLDELGNAATDALGNPLLTQTDVNGKYRFDNIVPGKYIVKFDLPAGYVFADKNQGADTAADSNVIPTGANQGKTDVITLQPGDVNLTIDAGLIQLVRLGDLLWVDTGVIGGQDGEAADPAASGVTVHLLDNTGAPVLNGGIPVTTTTDASGNYLFTNLLPGQYQVQFDLPTGYLFTRQKITTDGVTVAADSDVDASGKTGTISLVAGEDNLTIDAGIVLPASLGDYVWVDSNGNGIQDAGEKGFNNVKVDLYDDGNSLLASTTTADNAGSAGYYTFTDLVPGVYKVKFTLPPGYMSTVKRAGGDAALDSDIDNIGRTEAVTLLPGTHNPDLDAGIRLIPPTPTSELGNYVWIDLNENGIQDAEEQGLNGVTVELYNRNDALIDTRTTASGPDGKAGYYKFQSLQPGDYKVRVIVPAGYAFTLKNEGPNRVIDSKTDNDGLMDKITLYGGEYRQDQDAGLVPLSSLGDYVWIDSNKNGIQDAGEKGQNGIVVTLLNESGTAIATALTDTGASGNPGYYLFEGLKSGKYSVRFDLPVGFAFTTPGASSGAANDSNADASGKTGLVTLKAGASDLTIDAGLVLLEKKPEKPVNPENPEKPESSPSPGSGDKPGNDGNVNSGANPGNSATPPAKGGGKIGDNNAAAPAGVGRDGKTNTGALPKTGESMPVLPFIGFGLAAIAAALLIARRMAAKK